MGDTLDPARLIAMLHDAGIAEWDCDAIAARLTAAGVTLDPPIAAKVAFTADDIEAALKTIRGEVTYDEATIMIAAGAAASALRTGGRIVPLHAGVTLDPRPTPDTSLDVERLTRVLWNQVKSGRKWIEGETTSRDFAVAIAREYAALAPADREGPPALPPPNPSLMGDIQRGRGQ